MDANKDGEIHSTNMKVMLQALEIAAFSTRLKLSYDL